VIDLSQMRAVTIDPVAQTARVQGGAKVGDLINTSLKDGLITSSGNVHTVGLAGLTLGGGYGPLVGKFGLLADNLLSAEVVTASGNLVTASPSEHPDLFWGLRGGGGNFGAVVSLEYRLYPFPYSQLQAGLLMYTLDQAKEAYHAFSEFLPTAPDELTILSGFAHLPDGTPFMFISPTYYGSLEEGAEVLKPLRSSVKPFMDLIQPTAFEVHLTSIDPLAPYGRNYFIATRSVDAVHAGVIDAVIEMARTFPSSGTALSLHHFHGAASRIPVSETAFALRQDHFVAEIIGAWDDPQEAEKNIQWAQRGAQSLEPYAFPGGYLNFMGVEEQNRVPLTYGPNYERLLELKRTYDPDDVFRSTVGHLVPTIS
jgi:FAD/FMN-containing dehydrogenase